MAMDEPPVEAQMIRAPDPHAEHRRLAIDGEATRANPLLRLATRGDAHASEHFLQALRLMMRWRCAFRLRVTRRQLALGGGTTSARSHPASLVAAWPSLTTLACTLLV